MTTQSLDLSLKHQLVLTPQLQHAIKILNMNHLDLQHEISQMMAQNIMLDNMNDFETELSREDDFESEEADSLLDNLNEELDHDAEWDDYYSDDWRDHQPHREDGIGFEQFTANVQSLTEFLEEQIAQMPISDNERKAAQIVIYHLDEDGYFRDSPRQVAQQYTISEAQLKRGIKLVQNCQPSGVGARDLEECMNIQLKLLPQATPYLDVLKRIMQRHFAFIARNPSMICQRLDIDSDTFDHALALLRSLDPRPGHTYQDSNTHFIQPEIIVRERHGISYIETTDGIAPRLNINATYAALAGAAKGQDKTLLSAQLQEARWFLSAIEKRADTIKRVAGAIVAMQQDFFQEGELAMKPLTRQTVARMLDIHESTVSRAVNGKYLMCKRGLYELRYFFSSQLENTEEGEEQSTIAIKAMISDMIAQENPKKPLSDQKISTLLAEDGHVIARRTVTKYRESLDLPSSNERRQR